MRFTDRQNQIITGTLLGSSSIICPKNSKGAYLTMVDKREDWVYTKATELKSLRAETYLVRTGKRLRWRSILSQDWLLFRETHYKGSKKIVTMEILDSLQDIGWAIWFGDKGFYASKKRVGLRTTAFGLDGNEIIYQYFSELDVPCEIRKDIDTARIVFTKDGTHNFLKTIAIRLSELSCAKMFLS